MVLLTSISVLKKLQSHFLKIHFYCTALWSLYKYYGGASTFFISLMAVANFCHTATAAPRSCRPSRARAFSLPLVILLTNKNVTTNCRRLKQRQPAAAALLCAALRARRAQRNGCLQNSNDSFQPQKQVLQSSTERFVFPE